MFDLACSQMVKHEQRSSNVNTSGLKGFHQVGRNIYMRVSRVAAFRAVHITKWLFSAYDIQLSVADSNLRTLFGPNLKLFDWMCKDHTGGKNDDVAFSRWGREAQAVGGRPEGCRHLGSCMGGLGARHGRPFVSPIIIFQQLYNIFIKSN